jgi:3-hydroxymyristoyl/3-hydroxydecanoyl-(acyl carrier protein) dehydratase/predicted hotdog family 3-hydroxylacyl-ACP dehydratase
MEMRHSVRRLKSRRTTMSPDRHPVPADPLPWPAICLLPHRPPLLLVESLTGRKESRSEAEAVLPQTGLFVEDGVVQGEYFIELVAQTAALGNCYDRTVSTSPPQGGMIVGVDTFSWPGAPLGPGKVHIRTEVTMVFGPMKVVRGEVRQGTTLLAVGEVKVWEGGETLPEGSEAESSPAPSMGQWQGLGSAMAACCRHWQDSPVEEKGRSVQGEFLFPSSFPGFQGHFPGNPLLPAVLQLAAARYGAGRLLGRPLTLSALQKVKFKGMVRPEEKIILGLQQRTGEGDSSVGFTWKRSDNGPISSGTMRFS